LVPNPATNSVSINYNIESQNNSTLKYQIFNIQGKVIFENELVNPTLTGNISVDLSSLSNGIYLVALQSNNYFETKKLIVNK
jgi:hypothetical protein